MAKLESQREIDAEVTQLLHTADAVNRFPTPVEDIVAAQRLRLSSLHKSPFAPDVLAQAPEPLRKQVQAFRGILLGALDRQDRAIYVAPDASEVQQRFIACHEVGHDICPWQAVRYQLDSREQLSPDIRHQFEREANCAAAGLLFQQGVFTQIAASFPLGALAVKEIAGHFGASIHATFWHYVEQSREVVLGIILSRSPIGADAKSYRFPVKLALGSPVFLQQFPFCDRPPQMLSVAAYPQLATAWEGLRSADISAGYLHLPGRDGREYLLKFELFSNTYSLFLLAMNPQRAHSLRG
jgi:hypothetical protein